MAWKRRTSAPSRRPVAESVAPASTAKVQHISRTTGAWAFGAGDLVEARYELRELIAKGGMSLLWSATDQHLAREVVLKFLRLESGTDVRARFAAEARVAASLRSRHIIEVYDVGVAGDVPFMVLERLIGEDLGSRLRRRRVLSLAETAWVATQAARGLQVAHRAGVVHRDIKPSNLFLAREPDSEVELLKVLDFGIAKVVKATGGVLTRPGVVVGSPCSMSPEQLQGAKVDSRADLFSLGTVLYECLVGRPPFRGDSFGATVAAILRGAFDAPTKVDPALPRDVDGFFARALALNPADRFKTAVELASAFGALPASTG